MPKKKTKNQIAFEREIKRLTRFVKQAERQGIYFPEPPVPAVMPKRITKKALEKLQLTTRSDIQARGYVVDYETGETEEFKPAPSKKRYLSQIKPLMSEREKQKARKQAKAKELTTKRVNAIMKQWKIPKSAEKEIRKMVLSEDYTDEEKETFLRKISKFYNPYEPTDSGRWELPEPEPEEEKPIKTRKPVTYDEDEEATYFDVPEPDDFDTAPADGYKVVLDRLHSMLTTGKNSETKRVVSDALDDAIANSPGETEEEKKQNFVDKIRPNINKLMQKLYEAFTKVYPEEIADAAFDAISYISDFVDSDLQERIESAANGDGWYSSVNRRRAQKMGWMP